MAKGFIKELRSYSLDTEVGQLGERAANRIEKLEEALKYIAKHGRPIGIVDQVAKDALKYP